MIREPMITVEEAQERTLAAVPVLDTETVPLPEAAGRVLREDVRAAANVPPTDNTGMDGYAVRATDTATAPAKLRVIGEVRAGSMPDVSIAPGTAVRIMTGATIPPGADAVAQIEITDGGLSTVEIRRTVAGGSNIRRAGEDMRAGDVVLRSGTVIRAAELAVLATAQQSQVEVGRRPTVAILATGDELVDAGTRPGPGQIVNSNSLALAALVGEAGGIPRILGVVRDQREATIAAIESALSSDFVVSSGGVSVGAYDYVKDALEALGAETKFWRVAMKPGKPIVVASIRDRLYFGLPGNPVSSMVSFVLFVAPALRKAQGQTEALFPPVVKIRTTAALRGAGDRRTYVRVRVTAQNGELRADPMRAQGSGITTSMAGANGLAVVDVGTTTVESGSLVDTLLVGPVTA